MKILKLLSLAIITSFSLNSCQENETLILGETQTKNNISSDMIEKLASLSMNTKKVKKVDFMLPDGTKTPMYQLEGDINLTEDQIIDMMAKNSPNSKNYNTYNIVRKGTVIDVMGWNSGENALSEKEQQGLKWAVENYNSLGLNIKFRLSFGTYHDNKDIVVYRNPYNYSPGGQAGFPSYGRPHKWIQIHGMRNYHVNVVEHLITHEMGHCVGLRHIDWYTRQSCGQNSNEGESNIGAQPIPGTPWGFDNTSVMRACFRNYESGEFNRNDITALKYLYNR